MLHTKTEIYILFEIYYHLAGNQYFYWSDIDQTNEQCQIVLIALFSSKVFFNDMINCENCMIMSNYYR